MAGGTSATADRLHLVLTLLHTSPRHYLILLLQLCVCRPLEDGKKLRECGAEEAVTLFVLPNVRVGGASGSKSMGELGSGLAAAGSAAFSKTVDAVNIPWCAAARQKTEKATGAGKHIRDDAALETAAPKAAFEAAAPMAAAPEAAAPMAPEVAALMAPEVAVPTVVAAAAAASNQPPLLPSPKPPAPGPEVPMALFEDEAALTAWLHSGGVSTQAWGGSAVGKLLEEQRSGAVVLCLSRSEPLRVLRVVNVRVLSEDGRRTLVCSYRTTTGKRRNVGQPLSGKLRSADTEANTAQCCAKEELGVDVTPLLHTRSEHVASKSTSSVFPGLACRFEVVTFDAIVQTGQLQQQDFSTQDVRGAEKTTYQWEWRWRLALPSGALAASQTHAAIPCATCRA